MLLLNFSHPITPAQAAQIEALAGHAIARTITVPTEFDEGAPFPPQVEALVNQIDLSATDWQSEQILVVLPSLNFISGILLAHLHGRMGYFPPIVRTRPVAHSVPRRFEVAEILDLQTIRAAARRQR